MSPREYWLTEYGIVGVLPSGEEQEFATLDEYYDTYRDEENEIVDELFRLENERFVEYPEDYVA